jgi:hypothetical protein
VTSPAGLGQQHHDLLLDGVADEVAQRARRRVVLVVAGPAAGCLDRLAEGEASSLPSL